MNIEEQVINLDLAKRLKELGVKQDSLFYWEYIDENAYGVKFFPYCTPINNSVFIHYSAFTVAELGQLLPCYHYETIISLRFIGFHCPHFGISFKDDTEANCRAKMLIYLIENGLIKNE